MHIAEETASLLASKAPLPLSPLLDTAKHGVTLLDKVFTFSRDRAMENHSNTKHTFNDKTAWATITGKMLLPVPALTAPSQFPGWRENAKQFHEPVPLLRGITLVYAPHLKLFKSAPYCSFYCSLLRSERAKLCIRPVEFSPFGGWSGGSWRHRAWTAWW